MKRRVYLKGRRTMFKNTNHSKEKISELDIACVIIHSIFKIGNIKGGTPSEKIKEFDPTFFKSITVNTINSICEKLHNNSLLTKAESKNIVKTGWQLTFVRKVMEREGDFIFV